MARTGRPAGGAILIGWLATGLLAGLLAEPSPARADEVGEARAWLDRMAMAVHHLDYRGSLVYARNDSLEAMRVYHRVRDGVVQERLVSLTGAPREVLRDADAVRCIFPDEQSVLVESRITDPWFPVIPSEQVADPGTRYDFRLGTSERVAGMEAQVLHIVPKDRLRYGYQLWLERNTGMLLKSRLIDETGRPLEQVMFTELVIGALIADADLEPSIRDDGFRLVEFARSADSGAAGEPGDWTIADLPAGFRLQNHSQRGGQEGEDVSHMVFTDGLASVSVYVEPVAGAIAPPLGATGVGPINMFGARVRGYRVTAVGEVPSATVRLMVQAVRPAP